MRRGGFFWGAVLVILGIFLLLDNLGFLDALGVNLWNLLWPAFLILLGLWFLWGTLFGRRAQESQQVSVPSEGAEKARIHIQHGAGRLTIGSGTAPGNLLEGAFSGGVDQRSRRAGDTLEVDLKVPANSLWVFPFAWGPGFGHDWSIRLRPDTLLAIDLSTGANDAQLDLTDLKVTDLRLQTGASSTELTIPAAAGFTRAEIESGAASVSIRIPPAVAARIRAKGGLADINVDQNRFPRSGDAYQSSDYDFAANKIDLLIQTGVGSVRIR
jgi:hypothetical protein